jgi:hypothetical protein
MIPWSLVDVCLNASKFLCEFKNKIQRRRFGTSTRYGTVSSNWLLVVLKLLCNIIHSRFVKLVDSFITNPLFMMQFYSVYCTILYICCLYCTLLGA